MIMAIKNDDNCDWILTLPHSYGIGLFHFDWGSVMGPKVVDIINLQKKKSINQFWHKINAQIKNI